MYAKPMDACSYVNFFGVPSPHLSVSIPLGISIYAYHMQQPVICPLSSLIIISAIFGIGTHETIVVVTIATTNDNAPKLDSRVLISISMYSITIFRYYSRAVFNYPDKHTHTCTREKRTEKLILFNEIILLQLLCFRHEFRCDDRKCSRT